MTDMYNQLQEAAILSRYVASKYNTSRDVNLRMIAREYSRLMRVCPERRTAKVKVRVYAEALANCRLWLMEPRKQLTSQDIANFCVSKNYFNSVVKKEKQND